MESLAGGAAPTPPYVLMHMRRAIYEDAPYCPPLVVAVSFIAAFNLVRTKGLSPCLSWVNCPNNNDSKSGTDGLLQVSNSSFESNQNRLSAIAHIEFSQNAINVKLNCAFTDMESGCYVLV